MAETAKLMVDGKTFELPIVRGSEGETAIDISNLRFGIKRGCETKSNYCNKCEHFNN